MRICLLAHNRFHSSPRALATYETLTAAGHDVVVVAVDKNRPQSPVTRTVPRRSNNLVSRIARRMRLEDEKKKLTRLMALAASSTEADVYWPLHEDMLPAAMMAARSARGTVYRAPNMTPAGEVDLIDLAPEHPELAAPVHGLGTGFTPGHSSDPYRPVPGRHEGSLIVLCYRKTRTNPGRYLEAALVRSGMQVRVETDHIDLSSVDPSARFVLFVESPYPAIEVTGSTEVPILFWAHHGEHHIQANLRLANRYQADAVLLAHSWHLAHWFPAPVHRFPFGVAAELVNPSRSWEDRTFDVAMVGSNLRGSAWQYERRRQLVESLESHFPPERIALVEGVPPEEMADVYADSRVVIDEGGTRHYPITMRVFETIGSGAVLLTDPAPGLEMVFTQELHYKILSDDIIADVESLLAQPENTQTLSDRAHQYAMEYHTYDHRVDMLLGIAAGTAKRDVPTPTAVSDLARLVDKDVEVQRLIHDGAEGLAEELPDREVWDLSKRVDHLSPASTDAVVLTTTGAVSEELLGTARRYIYTVGDASGIDGYLGRRHPDAMVDNRGGLTRIDLMSDSYRLGPTGTAR